MSDKDNLRYRDDPLAHKARVQANRRKKRDAIRLLKEEGSCADCGGRFHHAAMQWDHLPGTIKIGNVSEMYVSHGMQTLLAEVAKCELVCANCHSVRTYERDQV